MMSSFDLDSVADREPTPVVDGEPTTLREFNVALQQIADVLNRGARQGGVWRHHTAGWHVARALAHVLRWQHGTDPEDLSHAATRLLMALQRGGDRDPLPEVAGSGVSCVSPERNPELQNSPVPATLKMRERPNQHSSTGASPPVDTASGAASAPVLGAVPSVVN